MVTSYRHINLLLDMSLYLELKDLCKKLEKPYSQIVRESLHIFIESQKKTKGVDAEA